MTLPRRGRLRGRITLGGALALGGSLMSASAAHAQVPFTAVGLGYPIRSTDARTAALGGVASGLLGGAFSLGNPADITLHSSAAVSFSVAGEDIRLEDETGQQNTGRSWFPVIGAVVPIGDWAFRVGFGGLLNQDLRIILTDTLSTSLGRFEFEELRTRDGGLSQIDISVARRLGPVSVGAGAQRLTGNLEQSFRRRFTVDVDSAGLLPQGVIDASQTDYGGWAFKVGANVVVDDRFVVSGDYFWTTELKAERIGAPIVTTFQLPTGFEGGASAMVTSRLMLTAGGGWSAWSNTEPPVEGASAADVAWIGGGVEYLAFIGSVPVALRGGARRRDLPFVLPEREQPVEQALTVGVGARLAGRVKVDFGFEFGSRGDLETAGLEEGFSGLTLTAALLQ